MSDKRILIVEDDAIVAMTIEDSLHELGYSVVGQAANAHDAIRLTGEKKPDLILMDIKIHGDKDGIETSAEINKNYNIPIIYLTAYSDDVTIKRAAKTQPYGFLTKPFRLKELYSTIEIALYKHRIMHREDYPVIHEPGDAKSEDPASHLPFIKGLLDMIGIPVFVLSRDMKVVFYNQPLDTFFRTAGCLDIRLNRSVFEIAPPSLIGLAKDYRRVFELNRMSRIERSIIIDDTKVTIGITIMPVSEGNSAPQYVTAVIRDISREMAVEDRVHDMCINYENLLSHIGGIMQITRGKQDSDMVRISALISEIVITIAKMDPKRWRSP